MGKKTNQRIVKQLAVVTAALVSVPGVVGAAEGRSSNMLRRANPRMSPRMSPRISPRMQRDGIKARQGLSRPGNSRREVPTGGSTNKPRF